MGHSTRKPPTGDAEPAPLDDGLGSDAQVGLDDRLRAFVIRSSDDPGRSWAERILSSLVAGAVRGDVRSQHEVFRRIGGPPASHRAVETFSIDDATARKVLEAVRGPVKDRSVA
ncbi:hypothetical protein [Paludisphaera borealis]|uniref:hypothetical protein n=1 Tax=Paludisphaera borealis TaxID=1387353 RepID=UPI0011AB5E3E|nr:hypothetical protein [Paludisphaera borealis]